MNNDQLSGIFQEYSMRLVELIYSAVKTMAVPGTGYLVIADPGNGSVKIQFKFEDLNGENVSGFLPMQRASMVMDLATSWLRDSRSGSQPSWKVLICKVATDGNFDMRPIYADDENIAQWQLDAPQSVNFIKLAKPLFRR